MLTGSSRAVAKCPVNGQDGPPQQRPTWLNVLRVSWLRSPGLQTCMIIA